MAVQGKWRATALGGIAIAFWAGLALLTFGGAMLASGGMPRISLVIQTEK